MSEQPADQIFGTFATFAKKSPDLVFTGRDGEVFRVRFEPVVQVVLADGVEWDAAARMFWNAVHRVMSRPIPFPDTREDRPHG